MPESLDLVRRIVERGEIDAATEGWIVAAFSGWWRDGRDPARLGMFMRLPTASRSSVAERNYWLGIAAGELPETDRAATLRRLAGEFMRKTWPQWRRASQPPPSASVLEAALFFAADAGAGMQFCDKQWRNIVRKSFPP